MIFSFGQGLGSQPEDKVNASFLTIEVKWKSVKPMTRQLNVLISYREYIILGEHLEVLSAPFESLLTDR